MLPPLVTRQAWLRWLVYLLPTTTNKLLSKSKHIGKQSKHASNRRWRKQSENPRRSMAGTALLLVSALSPGSTSLQKSRFPESATIFRGYRSLFVLPYLNITENSSLEEFEREVLFFSFNQNALDPLIESRFELLVFP